MYGGNAPVFRATFRARRKKRKGTMARVRSARYGSELGFLISAEAAGQVLHCCLHFLRPDLRDEGAEPGSVSVVFATDVAEIPECRYPFSLAVADSRRSPSQLHVQL